MKAVDLGGLFFPIPMFMQHNALKASCPATLEVLLRCVTGVHFEDEVRTVALECLTQFLHILLKSKADQVTYCCIVYAVRHNVVDFIAIIN